MDFGSSLFFIFTFVAVLVVWKGVKIVPQQSVWIIERLGKFDRKLEPGLNLLIPFIDRVAYRHSLKEFAYEVHQQTAITRDNVTLDIDGLIYIRIIDPVQASYGVTDPVYAVTQLAQTTMRSEIGKLAMDECFEERERLNANIVNAINHASQTWGIQCMRYEIKDIKPPASVLTAMEMQVAAERKKRAEILESEGQRQSRINIAEGQKQEVVLSSEGALTDQVNRAKGEAEAILAVAEANAKGIELVAAAIQKMGGGEAVAMKLAEQYIHAFSEIAQKSNTVLLPANTGDAGSMVAQAMAIFEQVKANQGPWKKA